MFTQKPIKTQVKKNKNNTLKLLFGIFLSLTLIAFSFYKYAQHEYYQHSISPVDPNNSDLTLFQIDKGENIKLTIKKLKEENLVNNKIYFWWYLRSNEIIPAMQAGTHYLARSYDYAQITKELSKARPKEINFTIPEGYRIDQIDAKLTEAGLIDEGRFIQAAKDFKTEEYDYLPENGLEGYLFPDTYRIFDNYYNFQSKGLIIKMINNFENKIESVYDINTTDKSIEEIIIMASIIEKETNNKDNRAVVAGILWQRIELGMLLGADATTRYGLQNFTGALTYEDLDSDSPYNTRKIRGLPPEPICNPGLASIKAAMYPEESEYLYYLHDANGDIHYSQTNEEHNANKAKYL